jgi:hypothetical protein
VCLATAQRLDGAVKTWLHRPTSHQKAKRLQEVNLEAFFALLNLE